MVDLHLSWSPLQLYLAAAMLIIFLIAALRSFPNHKKVVAGFTLLSILVIGISAFDVGTRQADLNRSRFDTKYSTEVIDKVENKRHTAASANKQLEATLTQKKEAIAEELK